MAAMVYILGALTSLACAVLLLRGYSRGKKRLLLWSGLCFTGLALSNLLIFVRPHCLAGSRSLSITGYNHRSSDGAVAVRIDLGE